MPKTLINQEIEQESYFFPSIGKSFLASSYNDAVAQYEAFVAGNPDVNFEQTPSSEVAPEIVPEINPPSEATTSEPLKSEDINNLNNNQQ